MNFNNFFNIFFYKLKQKNSFFLQNSLFFNKIFNNFLLLTLLFFSVFSFAKCTQNNGNSNQNNAKKTPKILCTTGILADGIAQIVGEKAEVQALMEAGTDPHLYKATPNDLVKMREADAIIYNGLHLEGKMAEVLEKFAKQKPILSVGDGLNKKHLRLLDEKSKSYDPHIWFSVPLWEEGLTLALDFLNKKYPENKEIFTKNFENYKKELQNLHTNAKKELQKIPKNQRVLITAHDAFGYFGQEYEVEVRGLQGISTVSEFGLKDLLPIKSGEIKIFDKNLTDIRQKVSYVPQRNLVDWDFPANVLDVVMMGRMNPNNIFKSPTSQDYTIAQASIQKVGLQDFTKRQISQLSGGQQQRVFLARALAQEADVYLLDEPFVAIDVATENTIIDLLKEMRQAGKTIVVVHHDLQTVTHYFDWVVLLNKTLVASGETSETFQNENLQKTYSGKLNFFNVE